MKKRIITGSIILVFTALMLFSRLYTPYVFDAFVGMMAIMGCIEISRVLERKKMFSNIIFVGCFPAILYVAMSIGIFKERPWYFFFMYFIVILLALFIFNFLYTIIFKGITEKEKDKYGVEVSNVKYALQKCMNSTFIMIYPALLFCALFFINHFFEFSFVDTTGVGDTTIVVLFYLIFTFVVTIMTDTFALVIGKLVKGPKLCPLISPNKTISGAIGGFLFGIGGGTLVYYLFSLNNIFSSTMEYIGMNYWKVVLIACVTSIIGQIGDIVASALKRSARVKDYGTIFPGHGGVMDRVDGLIFNAVVVLFAMFIFI